MGKSILLRCFPQVEKFLWCFSLITGCKIIAAWELIRHIATMSSGYVLAPTGDCRAPEYMCSIYILDTIAITSVFAGATIFIFALLFLVFTSGKNKVTAGNCASLFAHCLFVSVIASLSSFLMWIIHGFLKRCSLEPWNISLEVGGNFLGIYNVIVLYSYSIYLKKPPAPADILPDDDVTKMIRLRSISTNPPDPLKKPVQSHLYSSNRRLQSITDLTSEQNLNWGSRNLSERSNKGWASRSHSERSNKDFGVKYKTDLDNKEKEKKDKDKKDRDKDAEKDKDKNVDGKDKENKENDDNYNQPGSSKGSQH